MRSHRLQRWLAVGAMLALPVMAYAQEAALSGTVSDTTGGALPGVTVRAVHEATGNNFEAVTDERGDYRLAVRVGTYRVTAELSGFAPVTRMLTLLVGQQAVVNLQMGVSGVQESVTVTGEAPLLDTTQSSLGGNIDPRQLQELPVNGRNWTDLVMLAPGARANAVVEAPIALAETTLQGNFQINVDGQQVTLQISSSTNDGQPRYSRDAIAEFEFISSRFDATQSRSSGVQVNAVTKSGTNTLSGSFSGYFRDDRWNAADFVAKRVLPYQDQQLSGTFGGPIRRDKLHFFGHYEYERNPLTVIYTTPYPAFNLDLSTINTEKKYGVRLDAQFSPRTRLTLRGSAFRYDWPVDATADTAGGATTTPSSARSRERQTDQIFASLTQVLSNRALNEVKVGYAGYGNLSNVPVKNPRALYLGRNAPTIQLQGFEAGGHTGVPERQNQDVYSIRDDFTYSFAMGGRHSLKLGAEYLSQNLPGLRSVNVEGVLDATNGPIPANIESLFPDLFDASTWNLAPLSAISKNFRQTIGPIRTAIPRYSTGAWVQDDWTVSPRLTLNLGLRYDLEDNAFHNKLEWLPFRPGNRPNDTNNVAPRLGFSFSLNDRTVIRGGYGLYFGTVTNNHLLQYYFQTISLATPYDGRPDFASNPYNGPMPTFESLLARVCTPALEPGCIKREIPSGGRIFGPDTDMPYTHQPSIGVQRQLGTTMAIEADYVYVGYRKVPFTHPNVNLTYNRETGANYPFSDVSRRPYPEFGILRLTFPVQRYNSHALQTAFTKRFSNGWQASGTYTLSGLWEAFEAISGTQVVPFKVAPDLGGEYSLALSDQRHRAVFNGIWELGYGFQLSGLYFFGSGERFQTSWGTDVRKIGVNSDPLRRLRPDGTIVPRFNLVGKDIHRVDLRLQRRFALAGRAGVDGILELFNVFNHGNFGRYVTREVRKDYGQPEQSLNTSYLPRMLQLGFRVAF